jgi:Fic-DOC domain mobile mystery protein B
VRINYPPGATPLDPDSAADLIPGLTTQGELNEFEARNILKAQRWARAHLKALRSEILTDTGLRHLHRRMLDETWKWAGEYRRLETNIGVDPRQISTQVPLLCQDAKFWIENSTFPWPELAARFHHRLVSIHPFPNGNGRHARLAADVLLMSNGRPSLTWGGGGSITQPGVQRDEYLAALRDADRNDYARLLRFAGS